MPRAAPRSSGTKASARKEPYSKTSPKSKDAQDKENVNPNTSSPPPSKPESDWRDIHLDEIKGEVPCYDNASTVRRKLDKLINDKDQIPGTSKKWNKTSMVDQMLELEKRSHPVEEKIPQGNGPTTRALGIFLKKSGNMGGGDSPCYYWGNVLLEKLRIHKGEKKSKSRLEAEKQLPTGHARIDPKTIRLWCGPGLPMPSQSELANKAR